MTQLKSKKRRASLKQAKAINVLLEKGGSVGNAMRIAGYSEATIKNPDHLTKSKAYKDILNEAGLTDEVLSKKHISLLNSSRLEKESFLATKKNRRWIHYSDDQIKLAIEGTTERPTGCKLSYIKLFPHEKVAVFRIPDNAAQSKALEMGYKVKDHFASEKVDVVITDEMSDEERAKLDEIRKLNA